MAVWAGFAGAMLALAVLALAPAGWRLGLWHFRTSFYWLMPASAFLAAGAALLSVAGLTLGASTLSGFDAARAVTAIIVGGSTCLCSLAVQAHTGPPSGDPRHLDRHDVSSRLRRRDACPEG